MPNHKLSNRILDHMRHVGNTLLNRRLAHIQAGFPLTLDQLQAGILPSKWRKVVLEMTADGSYLTMTREPSVWIEHPDIPRPGRLDFELGNDKVVYCTREIRFDPSLLDPETTTKLIKYTNKLVVEYRMTRLASRVIPEFLNKYAPSVAHVVARWPALVLLTDPSIKAGYWSSRHNDEQLAEWHRKFRDPSEKLNRYRWDFKRDWLTGADQGAYDWHQKHKGAMGLIDAMLAMAKILPSDPKDNAPCKASIRTWKPLPDDRDKP